MIAALPPGAPSAAPLPQPSARPIPGATFTEVLSSLGPKTGRPPSRANGAASLGGVASKPPSNDDAPASPAPAAAPPPAGGAPQAAGGQAAVLQQAVAFSQLGVLGLSAPTAAPSTSQPGPAGASPNLAAAADAAAPTGELPSAWADAVDPAMSIAAGSAAASAETLADLPAWLGEAVGGSGSAAASMTASRALAAVQDLGEGATAELSDIPAPGRELSTKAPAASAVSVTISPDGRLVQVVAASPEITAEAQRKLFDAVAKASDEFGLGLSGLRLNGVPIGPRSTAEKGKLR